jgi:hypothetical protein
MTDRQHTLDDMQIPLAHAGRALVLDSFHFELADAYATQYVELIRHRYLACLFSAPQWGVIFETETNHVRSICLD